MDSCTRLLLAVPEQRRELGISVPRLARLSGVRQGELIRLERGEVWNVDVAQAIRAAAVLMVLETFVAPAPDPVPRSESPFLADLVPFAPNGSAA